MRRVTQLVYEPPDWKVAEEIKKKIVYLHNLNNLSVLTLWSMFLGIHPNDLNFYQIDKHIERFHLWLNSEI